MIPQDFSYDFVLGGYLLFLVPFFALFFAALYFYRNKKLAQLASANVHARMIIPRENWIYWSKAAALSLTWILATLAFMQPKGNGHYPPSVPGPANTEAPLKLKAHDVFFLIDASASMAIADGRSGQTRFQHAKEIADETLSLLEGENASLYAFTSHLTKLSPLTTDYFFLRIMLSGMQIDEGGIPGTDFLTSLSELPKTSPGRLKTLIIFSDGGDTKLESLPEGEQQSYLQSIVNIFKDIHQLRIYTVGLGKKQEEIVPQVTFKGQHVRSSLDDRILKALAQQGSGLYYQGEALSAVQLSRDITARMHQERVLMDDGTTIQAARPQSLLYDLYFQIPLVAAILLLSYVLFFPDTLRKSFLFAFLLFSFHSIHSQDMQAANRYAEAGDAQEALAIYKNLLQQTHISWEKNIYLYNMGVIYLKNHDWQKASETFQTIQSKDPLLTAYLKKNLALARYHQAISITPESSSAHLQKLYQLRDALQQIHLAKQADCALQKLEGNPVCIPDEGLNDFRLKAKDALAASLNAYGFYRKKHLKIREGISELLFSLSLLKESIALLQQSGLPENLRKPYQEYFYQEGRSWIPLWETIQRQAAKEQKSTFENAFDKFSEAMQNFQKDEYGKSLFLIQESEKALFNLFQEVWDRSATQEILQRLMESYQQISVRDTLSEALLSRLQIQQKQIASLLKEENAQFKEPINEAVRLIDLALLSLQQSRPSLARLFFEAAHHRIAKLLPKENASFLEALQQAIATQEYALAMNRLLQSSPTPEALSLVVQGQQDTLEEASQFLSSVFLAQNQDYEKGICQKKPWDAYLPSFNLGYLSAAEAAKIIPETPNGAIGKQEETLELWKQLKNAMETKKEGPSEPEIRGSSRQTIPQVLQVLQEMSNDDQIQNKSNTKSKQQIERPW